MTAMTVTAAREIARHIVSVSKRNDQFDAIRVASRSMPKGFELSHKTEDQDFYPLTVENVTAAIRANAIAI